MFFTFIFAKSTCFLTTFFSFQVLNQNLGQNLENFLCVRQELNLVVKNPMFFTFIFAKSTCFLTTFFSFQVLNQNLGQNLENFLCVRQELNLVVKKRRLFLFFLFLFTVQYCSQCIFAFVSLQSRGTLAVVVLDFIFLVGSLKLIIILFILFFLSCVFLLLFFLIVVLFGFIGNFPFIYPI